MLAVEKQPIVKHHFATPADGFNANDSLGDYLRNLRYIPLLTREEEQELATRMDEGKNARQRLAQQGIRLSPETITELKDIITAGNTAGDTLLERNQRLVVSNATRYQGRGLELPDLIQEGNVGLIRAAKKFDASRNNKFSTYATWWIRQAMDRAVSDKGNTIRTPVNAADTNRKIMGISKRLTQELGREPTPEEIAAEFPDMSAKKIEFYLEKSRPTLSLQWLLEDGDMELLNLLPDDTEPSPVAQSTRHSLQNDIVLALASLNPRDAQILELAFGLKDGCPLSLAEIGRKMGMTREWIRQKYTQALTQLYSNPIIRNKLKDYLNSEAD